MFALITVINGQPGKYISDLWTGLQESCGLDGQNSFMLPHFSWFGCEEIHCENLQIELARISSTIKPFSVKTAGLGVFTGPQPVLYIPIIRTQELSKAHTAVWEACLPYMQGPNYYYSPQNWMPHITLGFKKMTPEVIQCSLGRLTNIRFDFEIFADHYELACYDGQNLGSIRSYHFMESDQA